jgi:hypothetical protein
VGNTGKLLSRAVIDVGGIAVILIAFALWLLTYWASAVMCGPTLYSFRSLSSLFTFADAGDAFFLIYLLAPAYQAYRIFALPGLLGLKGRGRNVDSVVSMNWLASLFAAAFIAYPLANINLWIRYFGKVYEPRDYSWLLYGQNGSSGIPELIIALAVLIALDTVLLWEFITPREKAFRRSLKAAVIVNAVIYGAVIFAFSVVPLVWYYLRMCPEPGW